jgi:hypothetical protein
MAKKKSAVKVGTSCHCAVEGVVDLEKLRQRVSAEIASYQYEYPAGAVGRPWSAEKVRAKLSEFRAALVEPYWASVVRRDTIEQIGSADPPIRQCAIVADDSKGTLLAFDPAAAEFLLVRSRLHVLESFGISGDATGCFLAR